VTIRLNIVVEKNNFLPVLPAVLSQFYIHATGSVRTIWAENCGWQSC